MALKTTMLRRLALLAGETLAFAGFVGMTVVAFGFRSLVSQLVLSWMVVAWIATTTLLVDVALPAGYYQARPFEASGRLYECVGVRVAKRLLRRGPLRVLSPNLEFPKTRTAAGLRHLENEMRKAETIHVLACAVSAVMTGYASGRGWLDTALGLSAMNVVINGYPIVLQRYNRIRLQPLIQQEEGLCSLASQKAGAA